MKSYSKPDHQPSRLEGYYAYLTELDVDISDGGLRRLCSSLCNLRRYDTLINAAGALHEASLQYRVQCPNAFLKRGLREDWKPRSRKFPRYNGFSEEKAA